MTRNETTLARDHSGRQEAPTVLPRYAKAIAKVVEAGGPRPTPFMRAAMFDDDMKPKTVGRIYREPIIAVLEKYVRDDVDRFALRKFGLRIAYPRCRFALDIWDWAIDGVDSPTGRINGSADSPDIAMVEVLEAIASVVAGEKGEVG